MCPAGSVTFSTTPTSGSTCPVLSSSRTDCTLTPTRSPAVQQDWLCDGKCILDHGTNVN